MSYLNRVIYLNILAPWLFIVLFVSLTKEFNHLFPYILLIDVWVLSHPHAVSTFFKKGVFDKISKKNCMLIMLGLFFILSLVSLNLGTVILFNIYFFAQWFHYMRQNYGITISYLPNKKSPIDYYFQKTLLHLIPIIAITHLFSFGAIDLFGYYLYFPTFALLNSVNLKIAFGIILFIWGCGEFYKLKNSNFNKVYFLYFSSNALLYYFAYIYNSNFIYGWLSLTIYHNIQYLIFTWPHQNIGSNFKKFYKYYTYVAFVSFIVFGLIELGEFFVFKYAIPISLVGTLTINFTHYIYDSIIWKKA